MQAIEGEPVLYAQIDKFIENIEKYLKDRKELYNFILNKVNNYTMAKLNKPAQPANYPILNGPDATPIASEPEVTFQKAVGTTSIYNKKTVANAGNNHAGAKNSNRRRITSVITEHTDKPEWQMTPVEKMEMFRGGISKAKLEALKQKTNLDYDRLSTLLSTTRATLINKKGTEPFGAALSERIVSIADVYSYGFEVFEDEAKFNQWVVRPNLALGGKQPFDLLDNQFGREEVKNLIGRIEYGVYS